MVRVNGPAPELPSQLGNEFPEMHHKDINVCSVHCSQPTEMGCIMHGMASWHIMARKQEARLVQYDAHDSKLKDGAQVDLHHAHADRPRPAFPPGAAGPSCRCCRRCRTALPPCHPNARHTCSQEWPNLRTRQNYFYHTVA